MFNPNNTKQAQEVIFYRKTVKYFYPEVFLKEVPIERSASQTQLDLHLDQKLDFSKHFNEKISKAQKVMSVYKKLYKLYIYIYIYIYIYFAKKCASNNI